MAVRRIAISALLFAAALCAVAQAAPDNSDEALIGFLNQSIEWYRRVQVPGQLATDPSDSIYISYNRNSSLQVISLIFDFARAEAQQIQLDHSPNAAPAVDNNQAAHNLSQLVASAQDKAKQADADLEALQQQSANATGKKRQTVDDQIAEQKSELELALARLEALQNMNAFAGAGASARLLGKDQRP